MYGAIFNGSTKFAISSVSLSKVTIVFSSLCMSLCCLSAAISAGNQPAHEKPAKLDSDAYMKQLSTKIKKFWVDPISNKEEHIVAQWTIHQNGGINNLKITKHGSNKADELIVLKAIRAAAPFQALPAGSEDLQIEFNFDFLERAKPLGLTVKQALRKYGPEAKKRLLPCFQKADVEYPPKQVSLICLKDSNQLFVFARDRHGNLKQLTRYVLVSRSGGQGPKLKEGDLQAPEGFYKITALDAMTHMAMWVNYPNVADRANAVLDHRSNLGGNIQIHAGMFSTGCLVLNSDDMAELLLMGNDTGIKNIDLIVAPCNLVVKKPDVDFSKQPKWLPALYKTLKSSLAGFPIDEGGT